MTVPGYPVAGTHTQVLRRRGPPPAAAGGERLLPRPRRHPRRRPPPGQAAGHQLPQQPDRRGRRRATSTSGSSTSRTTNQVVVVQDAAHILLSYDGPPLSFLQVDGAKDVGVEVHSMSKGFNMIGWRIGWVVRPPEDRAGLRRREGQQRLRPVHGDPAGRRRGPATTPTSPARCARSTGAGCEKLVAALQPVGFDCQMPGGTYFLYTPRPERRRRRAELRNAEEATQYLIPEQSIVLRAVGRRGRVPALLGDVRSARRGARKTP